MDSPIAKPPRELSFVSRDGLRIACNRRDGKGPARRNAAPTAMSSEPAARAR
jgi:hypothetical protein